MRIQHNIMAMNAYRNLNSNNNALSGNLEKLSSGYRINRAGDDAAGLAISEKMRAQITGLDVAQDNAQSGINLVQTAEGALTEVHDMLNRMYELAEQSANGTYDDGDRVQLQKEVAELKTEINRIADSSNFNGINLLDGTLSSTVQEAVPENQIVTISGSAVDMTTTAPDFKEAVGEKWTFTYGNNAGEISGNAASYDAIKIEFTDSKSNESYELILVEGALGSFDDGEGISEAINSGSALASVDGSNQKDILDKFLENFTVTGTTGNLVIQVKDPNNANFTLDSLTMTGCGAGTSLTPDDAITKLDSTTAAKAVNDKAINAGYEVVFDDAKFAAQETFTIGDRTYEFVANAGDKTETAGATAIVFDGADDEKTIENIINQLKKDGYTVVEGEEDNSIRFIDETQLYEEQEGAQVSFSSDKMYIQNEEVRKQQVTISVAGATGANDYKLTINYVDGDGKAQQKTISYEGDTTAADNAQNMLDALREDKELSDLFDMKLDDDDNLVITSKSEDPKIGQFTNIITSDGNGFTSVDYEAGVSAGKVIGLKKDENDVIKNLEAGDTITINGKTYEFATDISATVGDGNTRVVLGLDGKTTMENLSKQLELDGFKHSYDKETGTIMISDDENLPDEIKTGSLTLQIGDTSADYNQLNVEIKDCHVDSLGLKDLDIGAQDSAKDALDTIKNAITYVSDVRGTLGATQNRLEHTINNLSVMEENITDAESNIRDTDVADEMMEYTKNNILIQSAQAMLAQANQVPQGVLQLLG